MTSEEARRNLEMVDQRLRTAAEQLIAMPSRTGQLSLELKDLAETIKRVYDHHASFGRTEALVSPLKSIQERLARVQLLLDSGVTFYCGAISTALRQRGAYTADGGTPRAADQGYFRVEA